MNFKNGTLINLGEIISLLGFLGIAQNAYFYSFVTPWTGYFFARSRSHAVINL
jgi:hypothetical protein